MIDDLRDLCRLMTGEQLALDDLVAHLGALAEDRGPDGPVLVRTAHPAIAGAQILREQDSVAPYLVILQLTSGEHLGVADLTAAFGEHEERRPHRLLDQPRLNFMFDDPAQPRVCIVIARVAERADDLSAGRVVNLSLRRDERLPTPDE